MKYILLLLLPLCSSLFSKEFISLNKRNLQENQIIYYNDFYYDISKSLTTPQDNIIKHNYINVFTYFIQTIQRLYLAFKIYLILLPKQNLLTYINLVYQSFDSLIEDDSVLSDKTG